MLLKHNLKMYPPKVTLTVLMKTTEPIALPVMFSGSLRNDHGLNVKLALPLGTFIITRTCVLVYRGMIFFIRPSCYKDNTC